MTFDVPPELLQELRPEEILLWWDRPTIVNYSFRSPTTWLWFVFVLAWFVSPVFAGDYASDLIHGALMLLFLGYFVIRVFYHDWLAFREGRILCFVSNLRVGKLYRRRTPRVWSLWADQIRAVEKRGPRRGVGSMRFVPSTLCNANNFPWEDHTFAGIRDVDKVDRLIRTVLLRKQPRSIDKSDMVPGQREKP